MRRLLMMFALAGCGGAMVQIDPHASQTAVEAVVKEQYDALRRGDSDAFLAHADPDGWMMGIVHSRRTPEFLAELHKAIDPMVKRGVKMEVASTNLAIGISPDGRGAWVSDELDFKVTMGEHTMDMRQRFTEVLGLKDGKWWVLADHMSAAGRGAGSQPEEVPDGVGPGADAVVKQLDAMLADPATLLHAISTQANGLFDPEGRLDVQAVLSRPLPPVKRAGGVRAGLVAGGQVAWAACNLQVGGPDHPPIRVLIVLLQEQGAWHVVQMHLSIVPEMG
jgi:ketosteroid isomerase-like protein